MSGYWEYGSQGHQAFVEHKANELLDICHEDDSMIDPLVIPLIKHAFAYYGAVSVWSCEGHPERGIQRGYITWIFKDANRHMAFQALLNKISVNIYETGEKAHSLFDLEANPLHHSTTDYDTMAMPALTLRTMRFNNDRVKSRWWDMITETAIKITKSTKGL